MGIVASKSLTASMRDTVGWRFRKFQTPDEDRPHLSVMQFSVVWPWRPKSVFNSASDSEHSLEVASIFELFSALCDAPPAPDLE